MPDDEWLQRRLASYEHVDPPDQWQTIEGRLRDDPPADVAVATWAAPARWPVMAGVGAVLLIVAAVAVFVASENNEPLTTTPSTSSTTSVTSTTVPAGPQYRGNGIVIEREGAGTRFCSNQGTVVLRGTGADDGSAQPPTCDLWVRLMGWDWEAVEDSESGGGARWGRFEVTGVWDGDSLTFVDVGPPRDRPEYQDPFALEEDDVARFATPCPEPAGRWTSQVNESRIALEDYQALMAYPEAQLDLSAVWVDNSTDPKYDPNNLNSYVFDPRAVVTNLRFTRNAAMHEDAIREIWGGPICVTEGGRTRDDLQQIAGELASEFGDTWSNVDEIASQVQVGVLIVEPGLQARLDERYGAGVVALFPTLLAVDDEAGSGG